MSRPFSYNDENFTLIGNVLFCHIRIINPVLKKQPILEIPPAIYDRMLFTSQKFNQVFTDDNNFLSTSLLLGVIDVDGKKYFSCNNEDLKTSNTYAVGYYILKDI